MWSEGKLGWARLTMVEHFQDVWRNPLGHRHTKGIEVTGSEIHDWEIVMVVIFSNGTTATSWEDGTRRRL